MNPSYRCNTWLGEAETLGWGFIQALHPEDRERYHTQRQKAVSKGQSYEIEYRLLAADGSYHWMIEQATPVFVVEDGKFQEWVVTCTPQDKCSSDPEAELEKQEFLVRQITEQKSVEEDLRKSEERYRSLVVATSQIVWTTDAEGQVVDMPLWRAYTGQSEEEVKGLGWLNALHPEDRDHTARIWQSAVLTKSLYETEYRIRAADGSYSYFGARGVPVLEEDGSIREWVGTCTDINDRITSESALEARAEELTYLTAILAQTNAALEKRNQELDQFAYVASHDLKAPLRAIANLSQWIEEDLTDQLTEDTQHQMNLLRGRVHRMEALINGLLQYSRVGRLETAMSSVSVATLLAEVIDSLDPPETFTIEVETNMPTLVTQRLPLEQVFSNLLSNAIKHHPRTDGKVQISVESQGSFYEFAIADDGSGIAPQYHEKVFGIFQTLEARDKSENTGIGLAIVKKIVEAQGGTIHLESLEGQGTVFRFTWSK